MNIMKGHRLEKCDRYISLETQRCVCVEMELHDHKLDISLAKNIFPNMRFIILAKSLI